MGKVDMEVITTIAEMRRLRRQLAEPVGFVPTMGYLHEGHLSLVRYARAENPSVVASIFVNPTQFGPQEDFESYPRDTQRDLALLEKEKTDAVFMPSAAEMYPPQFNSWVEVAKVTERLEGASRPTHFRGVTTVVAKLFHIVKPHKAYFGQKDFQQCVVIRRMVRGVDLDVDVVVLPTVREADGLAMSSRNSYLSSEERRKAACLYRALTAGEELIRSGVYEPEKVRQKMRAVLLQEKGIKVDYAEVADPETLVPLEAVQDSMVLLVAARIGSTRLIDNLLVL